MNSRLEGIKYKVHALMEGGDLAFLCNHLKQQTAIRIINTLPHENVRREELYALCKAIDALDMTFQAFANDVEKSKETT